MAAQDIDIGDGSKKIENDQEDLREGHSIRDSIEQGSLTGESLYFERTFDFVCPELPTSIYFWVKFTLSGATAVSSVAVAGRSDEGYGLVNVRLVTNIFHHGLSEATVRHDFSELGNYGKKQDASMYSISEETASAFREEGHLCFDFVLTVERCHSEQEGAVTPGSDECSH